MESGRVNHYITHNMTAYAKSILADARKQAYPDYRGFDEVKKIIVDDIEIPPECYPSNISAWSYNYISKTFNNIFGETAYDLLINMRMKVNWQFKSADEATVKFWMGLINSRVFAAKNRDFKVNLYMPGFGWIESIWNTGAPISGSAIEGSGHDGILGAPGSSYYKQGELILPEIIKAFNYETGVLGNTRYYGSHDTDANITDLTKGVTDCSDFEIHWIEKKGLRLNSIKDLDVSDIIDNEPITK